MTVSQEYTASVFRSKHNSSKQQTVLIRLHLFQDSITVFIMQAYQTSQYVVPCGGIFLGKWRSAVAGSSHGQMNVQSACALNTRYVLML
jgi:hypothetical protein